MQYFCCVCVSEIQLQFLSWKGRACLMLQLEVIAGLPFLELVIVLWFGPLLRWMLKHAPGNKCHFKKKQNLPNLHFAEGCILIFLCDLWSIHKKKVVKKLCCFTWFLLKNSDDDAITKVHYHVNLAFQFGASRYSTTQSYRTLVICCIPGSILTQLYRDHKKEWERIRMNQSA